MRMKKTESIISTTYLGDGVYAQIERGMIKLTTSNGLQVTNEIYLEDSVVDAFIKYLVSIGWLEPMLASRASEASAQP
jgi:hypothetical protein